jgi:predicted secreted protein
MAVTSGVIDGGIITVTAGAEVIACLTDATLNASAETIDTTCKNTDGTRSQRSGVKEWSVDISGNYQMDGAVSAGYSVKDLFTAYTAGTELTVIFGSANVGDDQWSGTGTITSWSVNAGNTGANTTFSATITGDGALTYAVVA